MQCKGFLTIELQVGVGGSVEYFSKITDIYGY